ncbi:MAG: 2-oxo acid dehydrogenase subunit E2 [Spirochaetota bacterium]
MIYEVKLPEISENVETGDVVQVLVSPGDSVEKEQALIELETEKAAVEIPSPEKGKVVEINVEAGDTVKVGQLILKLETEEEAAESKAPAEEKKAETEAPAQKPSAPQQASPEPEEKKAPEQPPPEEKKPAPAAPSVRRLAREVGVDIHQVEGTGPGKRITSDDVKNYAKQVVSTQQKPEGMAEQAAFRPLPDFSRWGEVERKPLSKVRQITGENTQYAWKTIPHVTQFDSADITRLEAFRKQHRDEVGQSGGKLTITAVIIKVAASALKVFPQFNASLDMEQKEAIYKKYVHIGVAVDTQRGLLVPVIRDVDQKDIVQLSIELTQIAEKARNKKITPGEMEGGNFTVSNLGGIGGTNFTPIIYPPQVAILGVSRAVRQPVLEDGQWKPHIIMPLALSYDHRIIDGADGTRFLRWIAQALEDPLMLVFEGGGK